MFDPTSTQALVTIGVAFLAAIPPTVVAYAALKQSQRNTEAATKALDLVQSTATAVEVAGVKADEVGRRVGEVHEVTNSNLTAVKLDLAVALEQVKSLRTLMGKFVDTQNGNGPHLLVLKPPPEAQQPIPPKGP